MSNRPRRTMAQVMHDADVSERMTDRRAYLPTAEAIMEACLEIQATWPEQSEKTRRVQQSPPADTPRIRC